MYTHFSTLMEYHWYKKYNNKKKLLKANDRTKESNWDLTKKCA